MPTERDSKPATPIKPIGASTAARVPAAPVGPRREPLEVVYLLHEEQLRTPRPGDPEWVGGDDPPPYRIDAKSDL